MAHNDRRKPCGACDREVAHTLDDRPYAHKCFKPVADENGFEDPTPRGVTKFPAVSDPAPTVEPMDDTKGPWFGAMYDGRCSVSECQIYEGDRIRADGQGGYECEDCGEDDNGAVPLPERQDAEIAAMYSEPTQEAVTDAMPMSTSEEFMFEDPTAPEDPATKLNVSGQPPARYEWRGSVNLGYLTTDPETDEFRRYKNGKPKGWTRATTFNKAASDSKAINDWGKRNIVIGASRRRDVLLRAHGLTHENDRAALTAIVAELEEAAGAKVGSDLGTYLHEFTELMDAGLKGYLDAPEEFRLSLLRYDRALKDAGLEPVPGLIERTTGIQEFGGVRGTFDRIFYHRPSGTYVIGDLKTGKTMEYAMDETNTQMWIYAHGVNQNGVYDWNTDTWGPARNKFGDQVYVRDDVGVIIHMPVQGPQAGTVSLVHADLVAGAKHAELCHAIRSRAKSKVRAFEVPQMTWGQRFGAVTSGEQATALWREAKAEGIVGVQLNELIMVARHALAAKG